MKLLSFILLFLLSGCQDFYSLVISSSSSEKTIKSSWAIRLGSTTKAFAGGDNSDYEHCLSTVVDKDMNVICVGSTFGSLGETLDGDRDAVIMKIDPSGELLWVKQIGAETAASSPFITNSSGEDYCTSVAVDNAGNIYCAGGSYSSFSETATGGETSFVIKLSPTGVILWVTQLGVESQTTYPFIVNSSASNSCNSIALDSDGNIFCGGSTGGNLAEAHGGSHDLFVMKLNPSGEILWLKQFGADTAANTIEIVSAAGYDSCWQIATDSSGNLYCAGGTDSDLAETTGGSTDAFLTKFDTNGNIEWVKQIGNDTAGTSLIINSATSFDRFNSLAIDKDDNIICGGFSQGALIESNGGNADIILVKFDPDGEIIWGKQLGSVTAAADPFITSTGGYDTLYAISVDISGNIYGAGFTASSLFEGSSTGSDPFVFKMNSSGDFQWVKQFGVSVISPSYVGGSFNGVALDSNGALYAAGEVFGEFIEEDGGVSSGDIFVMKFDSDGMVDI